MEILTATVQELQKSLHLGRNTVYKALHNGTLPHRKIGKRYIISKAAIEKWINGDTAGCQAIK